MDSTIIGFPKPEPEDTASEVIGMADKPKRKCFFGQIKSRADVLRNDGWDAFMDKNMDTFYRTNQDIIKEYMDNTGSTFEEAMKWAVKQDAINYGRFPAALRNKWEKDNNRKALEGAGFKRKN